MIKYSREVIQSAELSIKLDVSARLLRMRYGVVGHCAVPINRCRMELLRYNLLDIFISITLPWLRHQKVDVAMIDLARSAWR